MHQKNSNNLQQIKHLTNQLKLHDTNLINTISLNKLLKQMKPTKIYNLTTQNFIPTN